MRAGIGIGLALGAMLAALPLAAFADAWLVPPGELRLNTTYTFSDSVDAFDNDGRRDVSADFYMHELSILLEFGASEYLTLFAQPHIRWIDAGGVEEQGHSHTDVGLRLRVFGSDTESFSLQAQAIVPGDLDGIDNVMLFQKDTAYEARALYGARFDLHGIPAFINLEGAYRWRDGGPADEIHADFSFGWEPQRRTQVLIESLNVWGNGEGEDPLLYPYFRQHKARASLLMQMSPDFWLQVGGFYSWDGQNVIAQDGAFIGGRYTF